MSSFKNDKINLDDLYVRTREMHLNRIQIYQKILNRVHKRIKSTSRLRNNDFFCFYVVPEFLVGVPTYNISTCVSYLVEQLMNNGFQVKYTHPHLLFISWKHYIPAYRRVEIKKKFGIKVDGFGNLVKEKEEEEKKKIFGKDIKVKKKTFNAISTYKPTGNLIYSNELIKKINSRTG